MLGKTNIIYVAKDQGTDMQFVTETIVTRSSSNIVKMKYYNEIFFVFTEENHILYGKNIMALDFLQIDGKALIATDMEFFDSKYVFINAGAIYAENDQGAEIYVSDDLAAFEKVLVQINKSSGYKSEIVGIAITSYNELAFLAVSFYNYHENIGNATLSQDSVHVVTCDRLTGEINYKEQKKAPSKSDTIGKYCNKCIFMRDRFFFYSNANSNNNGKEYYNCITLDAVIISKTDGTLPVGVIDNIAYTSVGENTYYTLNFENYIKVRSLPTEYCVPLKGRIGLGNNRALEIASKISDFAAGKINRIEDTGIDYEISCFVEAGDYTYLGCQGGVIIQCFLDIDGTYQTPEIVLIKTLAAKEALAEAKKYTDERIAELKAYVDVTSQ